MHWFLKINLSISIDIVGPLHTNAQVASFQRCKRVFLQRQAQVKLQPALRLLLLTILQLYHLPPPLPPPASNSSCLFRRCQPLYASPCTVLLYFSRYSTIRLKVLSLFFVFVFLCILGVKSIINPLQYCTGASLVAQMVKNPPAIWET